MSNELRFDSEESVTPSEPKGKGHKYRSFRIEEEKVEVPEKPAEKQTLKEHSEPDPKIRFTEEGKNAPEAAKAVGSKLDFKEEAEVSKGTEAENVPEDFPGEASATSEVRKAETSGGRKKKHRRRLHEEPRGKKNPKLKFQKERGGSSSGKPMPDGTSRKSHSMSATGAAVPGAVKTAASGRVREKVDEDSDGNSAVEAANRAEETAENAVSRLSETVKNRVVRSRRKSSEKLNLEPEEMTDRSMPLRFDDDAVGDMAGNAASDIAGDIPHTPNGFSNTQSKAHQKVQYKRDYVAAKRAGKGAEAAGGSVIRNETGKTAASKGAQSIADRLKEGVVGFVKDNKGLIAGLLVCGMFLLLLLSGLGTMGSMITGGGNMVMETSYLASDDEIQRAENFYFGKETVLQNQVNNIESTYPGYDEYNIQIDEISHSPYTLASYLTVKYGNFTMSDVREELNELYQAQYHLSVESTTREEVSTGTDPDTGEETEEITTIHILNVTLTNMGLETVVNGRLNDPQAVGWYTLLNSSYGNRSYLWDTNAFQGYEPGGMSYEIPPEALQDDQFRRMITEAERYLGYPYVWGGSSPSTSFDCSGFVSWVINNCGNGWNVGRSTAEGLRRSCTYVPPSQAKPGDLIFFQGTYNTSGASHVGIFVGNGTMIHCGNPIQYASIETNYWQEHFYCFGRIQ